LFEKTKLGDIIQNCDLCSLGVEQYTEFMVQFIPQFTHYASVLYNGGENKTKM